MRRVEWGRLDDTPTHRRLRGLPWGKLVRGSKETRRRRGSGALSSEESFPSSISGRSIMLTPAEWQLLGQNWLQRPKFNSVAFNPFGQYTYDPGRPRILPHRKGENAPLRPEAN